MSYRFVTFTMIILVLFSLVFVFSVGICYLLLHSPPIVPYSVSHFHLSFANFYMLQYKQPVLFVSTSLKKIITRSKHIGRQIK